jgi:hypothetical protein
LGYGWKKLSEKRLKEVKEMVTQPKSPSLRKLAKELGISHSYLSQIIYGKRPASEKIVSELGKWG